jgi:hypothetical protein
MLSYGAFFTLAAIKTRDFARENGLRRLATVGIAAPLSAASSSEAGDQARPPSHSDNPSFNHAAAVYLARHPAVETQPIGLGDVEPGLAHKQLVGPRPGRGPTLLAERISRG